MVRMRTKKVALRAGLASVGLLGSATPAAGHAFTDESTVTIDYDGTNFYGSVSADHRTCKRNRTVRLYKVRKNRRDAIVGMDTTGFNGNYRMHKPRAKGRYYTVVARKVSGGYGHSHVCRKDRSPTRWVRRG